MSYTPANLSPMLRQYFETREAHPGAILLMRVGDFFEAYGEDAQTIAAELDLTLTGREDKSASERIPMAGVPFHALERYAARLISKGFKVAVCDQVEDPKQAKGLVKRKVTRILTPGTVVEDSMLDARSSNYLVAAALGESYAGGLGVVDVSTGEFLATEVSYQDGTERIVEEILRLQPSECLLRPGMDALADQIRASSRALVTFHQPAQTRISSRQSLLDHFGTPTLRGFGCEELSVGLDAAALLLDYVKQTHAGAASHIRTLATYSTDNYMTLDSSARRTLELSASMSDGSRSKGLVSILDQTVTSMGARLLRKWFDQPLLSIEKIRNRQDAVAELAADSLLRGDVRDALREVADLERLTARICSATANARDLIALRRSLQKMTDVAAALGRIPPDGALQPLRAAIAAAPPEARSLLERALHDEPPLLLREGSLIRSGYNAELDELRDLRSGAKSYIAKIEETERARTGIKTLKIGFNNVFGYYIEITKANGHVDVPAEYHRKQTTANAERYITPTLKEYEARALSAEEKIVDLEYDLFCSVRDEIADLYSSQILALGKAIGRLDVFAGLAEAARQRRFVRPEVHDGESIQIVNGRHPVVEHLSSGTQFVPNDTYIDTEGSRLQIITGPNSAGKSTYLRQVALICLLAQIGSFVPADQASIGMIDRIFTRIGASDDLAAGQSTFMVEMCETANILNNATRRSLVILDEIGRGTSTYDGLALAWATAEHLHEIRAKTLFATHYHHLNELEKTLDGAKNFRVAVKESGERIIWLRKIMPGGTDRSYGIQVARLAGMPESALERAKDVLRSLQSSTKTLEPNTSKIAAPKTQKLQMTLFEMERPPALEDLLQLDLATLSPIEALTKLYELQAKAKG